MAGKVDEYNGRRRCGTSKVAPFRQVGATAIKKAPPASRDVEVVRLHSKTDPLQSTKKNPSQFGLGFESTKGGGWRRHRAIDGAGHGGRCEQAMRYVPGFRFRTLARSLAPSFDGMNYTYGPQGCKKICSTKCDTTIRNEKQTS